MLEIIGLCAAYGKKQVLFDINTSLGRGKFTAIIGRNGSGKSTLLSCLASSIRYSGKILLDGRAVSEFKKRDLAKRISYLPQNLPSTQFTVRESAAFGREPYTDLSGKLTDLVVRISACEKDAETENMLIASAEERISALKSLRTCFFSS